MVVSLSNFWCEISGRKKKASVCSRLLLWYRVPTKSAPDFSLTSETEKRSDQYQKNVNSSGGQAGQQSTMVTPHSGGGQMCPRRGMQMSSRSYLLVRILKKDCLLKTRSQNSPSLLKQCYYLFSHPSLIILSPLSRFLSAPTEYYFSLRASERAACRGGSLSASCLLHTQPREN